MDVWSNNLSRKSKALNNTINEEHSWLALLKEDQCIQSYVAQLQHWMSHFEPALSIEQQYLDIQKNSSILIEYPMIGVQVRRLRNHLSTLLAQDNI